MQRMMDSFSVCATARMSHQQIRANNGPFIPFKETGIVLLSWVLRILFWGVLLCIVIRVVRHFYRKKQIRSTGESPTVAGKENSGPPERTRKRKGKRYILAALILFVVLVADICISYVIGYKSLPVVEGITIRTDTARYEVNSYCSVTKESWSGFNIEKTRHRMWSISRADWNLIVGALRLMKFTQLPAEINSDYPFGRRIGCETYRSISVDVGDTSWSVGGYDAGIGISGGNLRFLILYNFIMKRILIG